MTRSTKYSRTADLLTPATRKRIGAAFDEAAALLARGVRSPLYGIARAFAYHQRYSVRNRLLLWGQAQHSRMARSRRGWAALGRQVLPGAPAYYVIQPAGGGYGVLEHADWRLAPMRALASSLEGASSKETECCLTRCSIVRWVPLELLKPTVDIGGWFCGGRPPAWSSQGLWKRVVNGYFEAAVTGLDGRPSPRKRGRSGDTPFDGESLTYAVTMAPFVSSARQRGGSVANLV